MNDSEDAPELVRKVFEANKEAITNCTLGTLNFAVMQPAIDELCRADKIIFSTDLRRPGGGSHGRASQVLPHRHSVRVVQRPAAGAGWPRR